MKEIFHFPVLVALLVVAACCKTPPPSAPSKKFDFELQSTPGGRVTMTVNGESVQTDASGGIATEVAMGSNIVLTAVPDPGAEFREWVSTGFYQSVSDNPWTFKMPAGNFSATLVFELGPDYDPGVVIGGTKWASRNVDAPGKFVPTSRDHGMLYQWNEPLGWLWVVGEGSAGRIVNSNGDGNGWRSFRDPDPSTSWKSENDPCPAGWRLPTREEMMFLGTDSEKAGKITWKPVGEKSSTGGDGETEIEGVSFTDTATGNTIYFPAAGCLLGDRELLERWKMFGVGYSGHYWTATAAEGFPREACVMHIYSDRIFNSRHGGENRLIEISEFKPNGNSVRCVAVDGAR